MNDKDEDRCCPSHERRKLLTCSSSTACARTVGHQFSHVGSTLTTFVRRFSLAFFFRLFFSVFTFGLVVSTAGRAAYRGYIYFSWCSVRFHSRRRRSKKKKKTIGDARLLAVSPQACSLFTGCTKFARIYIDAT